MSLAIVEPRTPDKIKVSLRRPPHNSVVGGGSPQGPLRRTLCMKEYRDVHWYQYRFIATGMTWNDTLERREGTGQSMLEEGTEFRDSCQILH